MGNRISGSVMAHSEALDRCLRAAGLMPRMSELVGDDFWPDCQNVRTFSYGVWVTGVGGTALSPEDFPHPYPPNSTSNGSPVQVPEGTREVFVDVTVTKHGPDWSMCYVRIRTVLHSGGDNYWEFSLNRLAKHPTPRATDWQTFKRKHIPSKQAVAA